MPALTTENVNELTELLNSGNRGQFYWRYYEMTNEY